MTLSCQQGKRSKNNIKLCFAMKKEQIIRLISWVHNRGLEISAVIQLVDMTKFPKHSWLICYPERNDQTSPFYICSTFW